MSPPYLRKSSQVGSWSVCRIVVSAFFVSQYLFVAKILLFLWYLSEYYRKLWIIYRIMRNSLMWHCGIVAKWRIWRERKIRNLFWEIADADRSDRFCSEGEWTVAHTTRSSEGSQGCREDWYNHLNDGLPSFFLHSIRCFKLDMLVIHSFISVISTEVLSPRA